MKNITAIFAKQVKDTVKNKEILIQFVMFPILTLIMYHTVKIEGMPEHFFTNLFAVMYLGMAPLTCIAAVISEEKEKNTLRVLLMSNVKPVEYLVGVGGHIWLICMAGALLIGIGGGYRGILLCKFLTIMGVGLLISLFIGAAIGIWSKNQMTATSISVPFMLVLSFVPMLSMFNSNLEKISEMLFSEQIYLLINRLGQEGVQFRNVVILLLNTALAIVLFWYAYRRRGLD